MAEKKKKQAAALRWYGEGLATPLGELRILTDATASLRAVDWVSHEQRMHVLMGRQYPNTAIKIEPRSTRSSASRALAAYFDGEVTAIDGLQVTHGGTAFQNEVWAALRKASCGKTLSYGQVAAQIGRPAACRAVGLANGANLIGIVVPCHRIIGTNDKLTGYGGGLERKRWLIDHERQHLQGGRACSKRVLGVVC